MHETLFKQRAILDRYQEAPYAVERERFLRKCEAKGYSHSMLKKVAWVLLSVVNVIDIRNAKLTRADIETAIDRRTHFNHRSAPVQHTAAMRQMFIHIITEWVKSVDQLAIPEPSAHNFTKVVDDFCRYSLIERGLSPISVATVQQRVNLLFQQLTPLPSELHAITPEHIDSFLHTMADRGWSRHSMGALTSSLRCFFRYTEALGMSRPGLTSAIQSPRQYAQEDIPRGPAWQDVQKLLTHSDGNDPASIRNHAILMLLACYGFRRSEVASLALDDIDWMNDRITVSRTKQSRKQSYPLLAPAGEAILRYLRRVRPRSGYRQVFLALTAPIRPLSASSITAMVHSRLDALGIQLPRRGAHSLRHACAAHLLASGFNLTEIGDHLGHCTAHSTLSYAKTDLDGLRQVAEFDMGWLL